MTGRDSMTSLTIVNPIAIPKTETSKAERYPTPPRLDTLAGKTIGLFWNGKAGGQFALQRTRENLSRRFADLRFIDYIGMMGANMRRATDEQLDQMARECDAVIGTTSD
jgi:hypothetical protein